MSQTAATRPALPSKTRKVASPSNFLLCVGGAVLSGCILIALLSLVLPFDSKPAIFLLDHGSRSLFVGLYPVTIQNFLHLLTAICLGILFHRWLLVRYEERFLQTDLLPTDDDTLLSLDDLGKIRRRVLPLVASRAALPVLLDTAILHAMNTRSLEQAGAAISSKLELISHRLDLEYQFVRYIAWLVPTIGFVGTVVGIAAALEGISDPQHLDMTRITSGLGVAFYTTIIALVESAILVFVQNIVQRREELALNSAADYCMTNLVNRIHIPG
jgi:biopolymer transport protein ExbB/TolQ